jgi:hypothetical protein
MTLLTAISVLREDMPVIVITRDDEQHVEALAYTTQLANTIRQLCTSRLEQVFA